MLRSRAHRVSHAEDMTALTQREARVLLYTPRPANARGGIDDQGGAHSRSNPIGVASRREDDRRRRTSKAPTNWPGVQQMIGG